MTALQAKKSLDSGEMCDSCIVQRCRRMPQGIHPIPFMNRWGIAYENFLLFFFEEEG